MLEWLRRSRTLPDDPVTLVEEQDIPADSRNSYVPSVLYGIELHGQRIGDCDLRLGMNEELYYAGNIGYNIQKEYRGHGYAYEACRILFRLARTKYHMEELIITCSPDNLASKKTLQKLGGQLLETVEVPADHWLYQRGETVKDIYRFLL
jgi:predicted acetyltransferase